MAAEERRLTTPDRTTAARGHVLAIYGHPDDEGQATGTLAAFVAAGWGATLVCATRGEVGEISDPALATAETLGYTRELELRAAMTQIGLVDVRFLPFRDSGMAGTPENDDPRCLHQQPLEAVTEHVVEVMRGVQPRIVFTWAPDGGSGHPDHVAAHRAAMAAFDACADPAAYPSAGAAWQPERLYWGAFGRRRFGELFRAADEQGVDLSDLDPEFRARVEEALEQPEPPVSVDQDVSAFVAAKRSARSMHRTQFGEGGIFSRIPDDLRDRFDAEERFYRARPPLPPDAPREAGFAELRSPLSR